LVAGQLKVRLAAVICFGGGNCLVEFSFRLGFGESSFFVVGSLILQLTGLKNATARLLLNLHKSDHVTDGLKELHIIFRIHSIKVGKVPSCLQDMVNFLSFICLRSGLRSADMDEITYVVLRSHTKLGEHAFLSVEPTALNKLPICLRCDNDSLLNVI